MSRDAAQRAPRFAALRIRPRMAVVAAIAGCLVIVLLLGLLVIDRAAPPPTERPGWQLVFSDEFDGDSLDYFRWNARDNPSPRNNELQYYTPNDVRVRSGRLEVFSWARAFRDRNFTSGAVDTYQKFSFTHGRVEIRARLPRMGAGVWPAVWLLGEGCNPVGQPCAWPTVGATEIDIMEAVNRTSPYYINAHYGQAPGASLSSTATEVPVDLGDDFHVHALEWDPGGALRWYLNDRLVSARTVPDYFESPMYLLINTAIGGDWPGPPDAATRFPQRFDIDFVRIYKRA